MSSNFHSNVLRVVGVVLIKDERLDVTKPYVRLLVKQEGVKTTNNDDGPVFTDNSIVFTCFASPELVPDSLKPGDLVSVSGALQRPKISKYKSKKTGKNEEEVNLVVSVGTPVLVRDAREIAAMISGSDAESWS
jgi:hypothetical protein